MRKQAAIGILVTTVGIGTAFAVLRSHGPAPRETPPEETTSIVTGTTNSSGTKSGEEPVVATTITPLATASSPIETDNKTSAENVAPVASQTFLTGMNYLSRRDSASAIAVRDTLPQGDIERQTLTWAIAASGQSAIPSSEFVNDLAVLADWPAIADVRANLERALYRESATGQTVLGLLGNREIGTPEGLIVFARAALAAGKPDRAKAEISRIWRNRVFPPDLETSIATEFATLISNDDNRARMALLAYKGRYDQARKLAILTNTQTLLDAVVAVDKKATNADRALDKVDASLKGDPLYLYASIKRQRMLRNYDKAARLFDLAPRDRDRMVDAGAWWNEARIVSRGLMNMGRATAAYKLASLDLGQSVDDRAEAEFHAGWYALRGLKDAESAASHFRQLLAISPKAHDQARGHYWLARALLKKSAADAREEFARAADYPATFYGQLAASRMGIPLKASLQYQPDLRIETVFAARKEMRAISLLEQAGEMGRARWLYLTFAKKLESPTELQALADFALKAHGPSLALAVGKAALSQGHDPGLAAFPLGAIPDSADISGAGKALAYAIARQESAFNPQAVSAADARGLLQLLPSTAKKVAKRYEMAWAEDKLIDDPAYNATLGSHYLGEQIDKFNGSYILTFAAYNAGPNRVAQWIRQYGDPRGKPVDDVVDWIENIPFSETRDYVQKVMENFQVYKALLGQAGDIAADITAGKSG